MLVQQEKHTIECESWASRQDVGRSGRASDLRLDPTFTPKNIFNEFSGCFQGGSEQTRTHTQHVSIWGVGKSDPIAECSTPSARTFFRPLSACTPYRHSDTMPPTAKKLPTTTFTLYSLFFLLYKRLRLTQVVPVYYRFSL